MCEEESDDAEAVAKLLEINDSIHRTIERYKLVKQGDLEGAAKIPKGTLGTSTGVTKTGDNELSLIDFSGEPESKEATNGKVEETEGQKATSIEDDLLGLSMESQSYGQSGGIALGFGANTSKLDLYVFSSARILLNLLADIPGPSLLSSTTQESSAKPPTNQPSQLPQQQNPAQPKPNYDVFSTFASNPQLSTGTPTPSGPSSFQAPTHQPPLDPFAGLSTPQHSSPLPQSTQAPPPSSSAALFNFPTSSSQPSQNPAPAAAPKTKAPSAEDEWDFASALPDDGHLPTSNQLTVSDTSVKIAFQASRTAGDSVAIKAHFSNNTANLITEYAFQVAVTKVSS